MAPNQVITALQAKLLTLPAGHTIKFKSRSKLCKSTVFTYDCHSLLTEGDFCVLYYNTTNNIISLFNNGKALLEVNLSDPDSLQIIIDELKRLEHYVCFQDSSSDWSDT